MVIPDIIKGTYEITAFEVISSLFMPDLYMTLVSDPPGSELIPETGSISHLVVISSADQLTGNTLVWNGGDQALLDSITITGN